MKLLKNIAIGLGIYTILGGAYQVHRNNKINQGKKKLYDDLKLGSYSKETVKSLHAKKEEDLTAQELFGQLNTYASFGMGTVLNEQLLDNKVEPKNLSEEDKIYHQYKKAISTVDCMDAGLPYDDECEVHRCNRLKQLLSEKLDKKDLQ